MSAGYSEVYSRQAEHMQAKHKLVQVRCMCSAWDLLVLVSRAQPMPDMGAACKLSLQKYKKGIAMLCVASA